MAPHLMLAQVVADLSGNQLEDVRDAVVVYQLSNDQVGVYSFACCNDHSIKLATYAIAIMVDDPQPPRAACDPG